MYSFLEFLHSIKDYIIYPPKQLSSVLLDQIFIKTKIFYKISFQHIKYLGLVSRAIFDIGAIVRNGILLTKISQQCCSWAWLRGSMGNLLNFQVNFVKTIFYSMINFSYTTIQGIVNFLNTSLYQQVNFVKFLCLVIEYCIFGFFGNHFRINF